MLFSPADKYPILSHLHTHLPDTPLSLVHSTPTKGCSKRVHPQNNDTFCDITLLLLRRLWIPTRTKCLLLHETDATRSGFLPPQTSAVLHQCSLSHDKTLPPRQSLPAKSSSDQSPYALYKTLCLCLPSVKTSESRSRGSRLFVWQAQVPSPSYVDSPEPPSGMLPKHLPN